MAFCSRGTPRLASLSTVAGVTEAAPLPTASTARAAEHVRRIPLLMLKLHETAFDPMFHYARDKVIGHSLELDGQWAFDEIALLKRMVEEQGGGDFIDLGANVGVHTVAFAQLLPDAMVFAFEANEEAFRLAFRLRRTVGAREHRAAPRAGRREFAHCLGDQQHGSGRRQSGRSAIRDLRFALGRDATSCFR